MIARGVRAMLLAAAALWLMAAPGAAAERVVVFGGLTDFFPYEYVDSSGKPRGFNVELARSVARALGWKAEIRLMDSSGRSAEALQRGEVDVLLGSIYSEGREREFEFSNAHSTIEFSFFTRNGTPGIFSLEDLMGRTIGIHDLGACEETSQSLAGFRQTVFRGLDELFLALRRGNVDAAFCPKMTGMHLARSGDTPKVRVNDSPVFLYPACFAVRKGETRLAGELNDGLASLRRSGEYFRLSALMADSPEESDTLTPGHVIAALPLLALLAFVATRLPRVRGSIQDRLALVFVAVTAIPLLVLGVANYLKDKSVVEAKVTSELEAVAQLKASQLSQWLERAKAACRLLANDPSLNNSLATLIGRGDSLGRPAGEEREQTVSALRDHLGSLVKGWGYSEFHFITTDGTVALSTNPAYEGLHMEDHPSFWGAMVLPPGEVYIRDIYYSERTRSLSIGFSTCVSKVERDKPWGYAMGVVFLRVDVDRTVYPLVRSWPNMGRSGEIMLLRREGDQILCINNTRLLPDTALKLAFPVGAAGDVVRAASKAFRGQHESGQITDYRGVPVLFSCSVIPQTEWVMMAKQDSREALEEITAVFRQNYFMLLFLIGSTIVVSLLVSRSISRPIKILDGAVRKVTQGHLDVQPDIKMKDEIGNLARSFKTMTDSLRERFNRSERLSALGTLAATLTHEVRTPLTSMKITVQSLEKNLQLDDDLLEDFRLLRNEIDRLNQIVTRFLTQARPPSPTFRPVDVNGLLGEVLNLLRPKLDTMKIRADCAFSRSLPAHEGDEKQLRQVFLNMFLNAIDAMPGGGCLSVSTQLIAGRGGDVKGGESFAGGAGDGRAIEVLICDTGEGIPPECLPHVFDPFFTTKEEGTGLGLSVASSIVEKHGGTITAHNGANGGSRFAITLPVSQEMDL